MSRLLLRLKALIQLGLPATLLYGWHQVGVRSGLLKWRTPSGGRPALPEQLTLRSDLLPLPAAAALQACLGAAGLEALKAEAAEILSGQVRLFGGPPVPLQRAGGTPWQHWTAYEHGLPASHPNYAQYEGDIKFTWEQGRLSWAVVLARAYQASPDESYAQFFWEQLEAFLAENPPNLGPQWASAQEVGLRLVALVFASQVFAASPESTPERRLRLAQALADHADRIPPTLAYARAQNNNHLVSEALGLFTAGLALPDHPRAAAWRSAGWRWLNQALQAQIDPSGVYVQHSTNYHRLVLQAALWADGLRRAHALAWEPLTQDRLAAATRWLLALCDPPSGQVPNLGPNDGAWFLPLAAAPFADYRPTLGAAGRAFCGEQPFPPGKQGQTAAPEVGGLGEMGDVSHLPFPPNSSFPVAAGANRPAWQNLSAPFPPGPWDETALWLGLEAVQGPPQQACQDTAGPACLRASDGQSWAYLRLARFTSRPGHADQLHLDLWWKGLNLAQDPGTYRYNAPPPWENALTHTAVHNTLTLNGLEQMTRAGRFLYLDWAQTSSKRTFTEDGRLQQVISSHNGYARRLGLIHQRQVICEDWRWIILDEVRPTRSGAPVSARLHWLAPDLPWEMHAEPEEVRLRLQTPHGWVSLGVRSPSGTLQPLLVRAGERLAGSLPAQPTWGWTAPTYGTKIPALSFSITLEAPAPLILISEWTLPST
jgi:hypothetical protein